MSSPYPGERPPQQFGAYPPAPPNYGGYPPPARTNGLAVAGLVCGIIGLVLFWVPLLGLVLAILGIIFGGVGIARANAGAPNKGQAIAGLTCGLVTILRYALVVGVAVSRN